MGQWRARERDLQDRRDLAQPLWLQPVDHDRRSRALAGWMTATTIALFAIMAAYILLAWWGARL